MVSIWKKTLIGLSSLALIAVAGHKIISNNTYANVRNTYKISKCQDEPLCFLDKDEIKELIGSIDNFIKCENESAVNGTPNSGVNLENIINKHGLDLNIFSSGTKKEFLDLGYVLDVSRCNLIKKHKGAYSYQFGKISKIENYNDNNKDKQIIYYSSEGFAKNIEYFSSDMSFPFWRRGENIFVNTYMVNHEIDILFRRFFYDNSKDNSQDDLIEYKLPFGDAFLEKDISLFRKDNPDLTKDEFLKEYIPIYIKSNLEHEKSHARNNLKDRVDSETVAFLEQLEYSPIYMTFGVLEASRDVPIYSEARNNIFGWFEEKGYPINKICDTPLEKISSIAGKILEDKYIIKYLN